MLSKASEIVAELRNSFNNGKTLCINYRIKQLKNLLRMYEENKEKILAAEWSDLRKSKEETLMCELDFLINDLKKTLGNIKKWNEREYVEKDFANILDTVYIQNEPYGVVLIISAWNYPFLLSLLPVHGAIAAGNCVILKPSEISEASAKFMEEFIPQYLDTECYKVYNGAVPETTELLKERFDLIFYVGNTNVGKIVHAAANKYLTPVVLELGGKSPCYLDKSANLQIAAKRILWGKLANAGQTCIAPDYLLCTKEVENKFIEAAKLVLVEFYGNNPKESTLSRIVNQRHFQRLQNLINSSGGKIALGGDVDASEKYISPTILTGIKSDAEIMKEEIFGPILPIINVNDAYEAVQYIKNREKPLALYVFSNNKKDVDLILKNTSSGDVCVNDTMMHLVVDNLPFGGVGNSGMGCYRGKFSFDTFSHRKGVLYKDLGFLGEKLGAAKYPPLTPFKIRYLSIMLALKSPLNNNLGKLAKYGLIFLLGLIASRLWENYFDKFFH